MAIFRNVGAVTTIAPGATHYWRYWFLPIADVGAAVATPNHLLEQSGVELVVRDPGVVQEAPAGEGGNLIRYTARIHNLSGVAAMQYNLNLGNFT